MVGCEDSCPFGLSQVAVILRLVRSLVNHLVPGNIGSSRDDALAFAERYDASFKTIESRTLPSFPIGRPDAEGAMEIGDAGTLGEAQCITAPSGLSAPETTHARETQLTR